MRRSIMLPIALSMAAIATVGLFYPTPEHTPEEAFNALCPADDTPLAAVFDEAKSRPLPLGAQTISLAADLSASSLDAWQAHMTAARELSKALRHSDEVIELTGAINANPASVEAYEMRANALSVLGRQERSLKDYDRAIELGSVKAYKWRGWANVNFGRYADALSDFKQAVRVNPDDPEIYKEHGFQCARFARFRAAAHDFQIAANLQPSNEYAVIWRYIMQRRLGDEAAQRELEQRAAALDLAVWPGPVVRLFLEQITPGELNATPSATQVDLEVIAFEGPYYRAQYHLFHGDKTIALDELRIVAAIRRIDFEEFHQAQAELARLDVQAGAELARASLPWP